MIASVYSTLSGTLTGKHPTLGVLVSADGMVRNRYGWTKGWKDYKGYLRACVCGRIRFVHRLVAETFIPNPDNKPTVDHINRDRTDNRLCNLRWADFKEQADNTKKIDRELEIVGVRSVDDFKSYKKSYYKNVYKKRIENDPTLYKEEREKANKRNRKYKAKKRAERNAQPS